MKKRLFLLTIIFSFALLLIACSDTKKDSDKKIEEKAISTEAKEESRELEKNEKTEKSDEIKTGYRKGNRAVDFELVDLEGNNVKLSDLKGSPVVVNFFASWCHFCKIEMPDINKAYEKYSEDGVKFIGINLAFQDNQDDVDKMLEDMGIKFTIVKDTTGVPTSKYGITGIPVTVFIDKEGIVSTNHVGVLDEKLLDQYISEML